MSNRNSLRNLLVCLESLYIYICVYVRHNFSGFANLTKLTSFSACVSNLSNKCFSITFGDDDVLALILTWKDSDHGFS